MNIKRMGWSSMPAEQCSQLRSVIQTWGSDAEPAVVAGGPGRRACVVCGGWTDASSSSAWARQMLVARSGSVRIFCVCRAVKAKEDEILGLVAALVLTH